MPTEDENVKFLYLTLTINGPPAVDWEVVGTALGLKKGAVTKRWSRLKKAMDDGKSPGPSAHELLWLCVKHSQSAKSFDWKVIADACNTTPGAASKRFSRLKPAQAAGATFKASENVSESQTPKRKREGNGITNESPTPKHEGSTNENSIDAVISSEKNNTTNGHGEDNEPAQPTPKKQRKAPAAKAKPAPKPKTASAKAKATNAPGAAMVKTEAVEEDARHGEQDIINIIKQEEYNYFSDPVPQNDMFGSTALNNEYCVLVYGQEADYDGSTEPERNVFGDMI